jgi:MSHA biogenesis protein MshJ
MAYLNQFLKQFMNLSTRERVLALAAFLGVVYFVFELSLLRPQQAEAKALREQIAQQEAELAAFNGALQTLAARGKTDPLAAQRAERAQLRDTVAQGEAVIGRAAAQVRMGEVIRSMVASTPGLTLVSLKTLPVETFFQGASSTLYKHGIDVTVQGSYAALIPYLRAMERNANGIFWNQVKLDVVAYPDATLKITVYTLSARPELPLG